MLIGGAILVLLVLVCCAVGVVRRNRHIIRLLKELKEGLE